MKYKQSLLQASSILLLGTSAHATVLIDGFSDTVSGENIIDIHTLPAPATATSISTVGTGLSGVLEGQRNLTLTRTSATGIGDRQVMTTISDATNPFLEYSSTTGASGTVLLSYGQGTPNGGPGSDLSGESAFEISFASFDGAGGQLSVGVTVLSGDSNESFSQDLTTNGGILRYEFADFVSIDFADVDQIDVSIIAGNGADYDLNSISAVPEPSATMLLGIAFGAGLMRRRR